MGMQHGYEEEAFPETFVMYVLTLDPFVLSEPLAVLFWHDQKITLPWKGQTAG
jgi:hypothetical protein